MKKKIRRKKIQTFNKGIIKLRSITLKESQIHIRYENFKNYCNKKFLKKKEWLDHLKELILNNSSKLTC